MKASPKHSRRWLLLLTLGLLALVFSSGWLLKASSAKQTQTKKSDGDKKIGADKKSGADKKIGADKSMRFPNIDVRVNGKGPLSKVARRGSAAIASRARAQGVAIQKGLSRLRATVPNVEAKVSPLTGAVEVLRSSGALTGPAPGRSGNDIVLAFVRDNSALYGLADGDIDNLRFMGESVSRVSGLRMVRVEQVVNGLPVFQSETRFIVDRDGRVIRSTGPIIPDATAVAPALGQTLSAEEALRSAAASVGITLDVAQMNLSGTNSDDTRTEVITSDPQIAANVPSKLVYFPVAPGVLVPAWSQITFTSGDADWYTLVDATSGELLWRKNIRNYVSTHQARFSVYVQADGKTPADSPAPQSPTTAVTGGGTQFPEILRTTVNMLTVQDILASPNGWIDDCPGGVCTAAQTQTIGNNVHAYLDRSVPNNVPDTDVGGVIDGNGKPTGNPDASTRDRDFFGTAPRDYTLTPPPQAGNPEAGTTATGAGSSGTNAFDAYRRGAITQLFYVCNWYHDQLFALGFDEAAGNFQQTNFSGMGIGNDRVLAEAQDNTGTNNANFSTPPDGTSGRAQMFRFTFPTVDRDGGLDAEILIHELTHGTSNRIIGNAAGLNWEPGGGMGEGWSDFYALSLLNNTNADDPNGKYAAAAYITYKLGGLLDNYVYGIRRFPYSTDNTINPMTWADVDDTTANMSGGIPPSPLGFQFNGGMEVHNSGEIWGLTLWEVRSRVIADPAGANGDVPTGNNTMLSIVTDGMKMTPISPSFTEGRDALVDADCAANACANEQSIWDGFADRGLGYNASAPIGYGFTPFAMHMGIRESFLAPYLDFQSVTIDDSLGNNNGAIDPGEAIRITVTLKNPWRNAGKGVASATATLSSSTAGVVITDPNSTYPAIPAQGNASGDQFSFNVPAGATCGQSLKFTITPTSTLGSQAVDFVLRVGAVSGTGAPVTYTRDTSPNLAIPDNNPLGVIDSLTITDDFEIADINFRVDSVTHTFPGDLTVMLRAPNGYGVDFIAFLGGAAAGGGDGDNMTNMVIDDSGTGDQLLATNAQAPYTGSWLPAFNGPAWATVGFGPPDPVGELGRLNGTSTNGVWKVLIADEAAIDIGTLNQWALIVTPTAFTCQPVGTLPPNAGDLLISEFRLRGSGGANDEFIEIYNATGAALTVQAADASAGLAVAASDGGARCVIPNGTVIPAGGHFLCTNSTYSLTGYATGDLTYTADIPDNAGIALFNNATGGASFSLANRIDAVGSTAEANTLYKEGTGYPPLTAFSLEQSFYRDNCGKAGAVANSAPCTRSVPGDTNNNSVDFIFVDPNGLPMGAGQRLGAPGPENLASPIQRNATIKAAIIDNGCSSSSGAGTASETTCARHRDTTSDPPNNSSQGTLSIRRNFKNNTGAAVTRLRFRIVDITTFLAPAGTADLRARTSSTYSATCVSSGAGCPGASSVVSIVGTTLEQPPQQLLGGGFNSSLSAGTVTLGSPLVPGASINLQFLLGVEQGGSYRFYVNVEALP